MERVDQNVPRQAVVARQAGAVLKGQAGCVNSHRGDRSSGTYLSVEVKNMATVTFDKATRIYPGSDKPAVKELSLEIADGEFLVLVGPSGCGKSTSLRMLAGLEDVNSGRIFIGDRDVTDVQPKNRDIAMVFQNYALYPHMTVRDNIGFALKIDHSYIHRYNGQGFHP